MKIIPARVELSDANAFVLNLHRHHKPVTGHRFSVGCAGTNGLCGVAIVGRPVARMTDQKTIAEVARLCTDGTKNACSYPYSACARIATELGYSSIQTFILNSEDGTSLKAAGWTCVAKTAGGDGWQSRSGRRSDQPTTPKTKWQRVLQ